MRRVILETPYAGDVERNVAYARRCMHDSLKRGEAPLASHLLYTQVLNDSISEERWLGIAAGSAWEAFAEAIIVYTDLGISPGMHRAVQLAERAGRPIEYRTLPCTTSSVS